MSSTAIITDIAVKRGIHVEMTQIGQMVRFHRKKSGLSQTELGHISGVGKTVVYDVEKGKLTIRLATLLKLLKVLNVSIVFQSPLMELFENEKS